MSDRLELLRLHGHGALRGRVEERRHDREQDHDDSDQDQVEGPLPGRGLLRLRSDHQQRAPVLALHQAPALERDALRLELVERRLRELSRDGHHRRRHPGTRRTANQRNGRRHPR